MASARFSASACTRSRASPSFDTNEIHELIPLSLAFAHRTVTGGEAGRFRAAVIAGLQGRGDDLGATS
jgi:pyruvate/2-oxoglutarate dehydrogenase complex dihydrolipoamide acyltransferase (E2) component